MVGYGCAGRKTLPDRGGKRCWVSSNRIGGKGRGKCAAFAYCLGFLFLILKGVRFITGLYRLGF
ncbi:hypothetical protein HanXRQr2_Chr03g0122831 [Helianthus annuus]|uniref:Uncharacterized protein n=1 Tax=Helianthus annuus TaxID=4232 RepID=A0A9K3JIS2_HELAN|nr:hypothetical protein HanXRQr2_Chr03g0122831 [Helianthus annuus]